jgi:hypothetical protein
MRAIIGTGTTLLLTGAAALAVKAVRVAVDHETRISVLEDHQKGIDDSLKDLKVDTKEILKRMPRR